MSIRERAIEIIAHDLVCLPEQVVEGATLVEDLGADSLDLLELMYNFGIEFDVDIPDEVAAEMKTVGQVLEYLEMAVV